VITPHQSIGKSDCRKGRKAGIIVKEKSEALGTAIFLVSRGGGGANVLENLDRRV